MHLELDPHPHPHPHPTRQRGVLPWILIAAIIGVSAFLAFRKGKLDEVGAIRRFHEGVALLEQYSYEPAFDAFSDVVDSYPDWTAARFNLGLAALNRQKEYLKTAEAELREVLRSDPRSLHAHFTLGILYKHLGRLKEAFAEFEIVAKGDPADPYAQFEYGAALSDEGKLPEARAAFEATLKIQPAFASAIYRLAQVSQRLGDRATSEALFARFKALELNKEGIKSGVAYGEGGKYLSAIREAAPPKSGSPAPLQAPPKPAGLDTQPRVATVPAATAESISIGAAFTAQKRPDGSISPPAFALGDLDGDGAVDLVLCGQPRADGTRAEVWKGGPKGDSFQKKSEIPADGSAVAVGDLDGDSDLDVVLAAAGALRLFDNDGRGNFAPSTQKLPDAPPGFPVQALVFDADSDWDLDAVVVSQIEEGGKVSTALAILQNNRDGSFADAAPKVGFSRLPQASRGALFADFDGDIDADILCLGTGPDEGTLLVNDRAWAYRRVPARERGGLAALLGKAMLAPAIAQAIAAPPATEAPSSLATIRDAVGRSFSLEGRAGEPLKLRPAAGAPERWVSFDLNGPKEGKLGVTWSNLAGIGATVEVRAGGLAFLCQVLTEGSGCARGPARAFFDLGGAPSIDYVRILWPDGVLQVEKGIVLGMLHTIEEIERKPVSCPILFAWDGERFAYVGDFLGVGGLGYLEAPGFYSRPDPTEVLELPSLAPLAGSAGAPEYQLRIAEPLEECTYLDAVELIAVDGPANLTLHPDELFAVRAPAPPAQLLAFKEPRHPERATDARSRDVTDALRRIDRVYADGWSRDRRFPGAAEPHSITLEWKEPLPRGGIDGLRPVFFLHGYVEYGYSTSNFAASQANVALHAPTVSVERGGKWVPLREEWGFPGGTPRWMAMDLEGLLEPGDRKLRVSTDMEIYWDHAFVAEAVPVPLGEAGRRGDTSAGSRIGENAGVRATVLPATRAELRFLGFPRTDIETYDYTEASPSYSMKPFPGRYTRYGDVRELIGAADDRFAIFGSGEEIAVSFDAARLPELPAGWKRTFFFSAVGYCKDMDLYTAGGDRVEPLPFRAMSAYPPPAGEKGPEAGRAPNDREIKPLALGTGE